MNMGSSENELLTRYFPQRKSKSPAKAHNRASPQECVGKSTKTSKKVRLDLNFDKMLAKIQSCVGVCGTGKCQSNKTRYIVGRYKPVLLTKLNKKEEK